MQIQSATELLLNKTYKEVWYRGQEYANSGRVKIVKADDKEVGAVVEGTRGYVVRLKVVGNGIRRDCTCPYPKGICKHMVAVAILWDEMRGIERPTNNEIQFLTIAKSEISKGEIDKLFDDPLNADLDKLRIAIEYTALPSRRLQTHARLPKCPKISSNKKEPLIRKEISRAFKEMERWADRRNYDTYFCAGEMAAAFSELLEVIEKRLLSSNPEEAILIMADCVNWYFRGFNQIIDGSDGVWIFPETRIGKIVSIVLEKYPQSPAWEEFREIVEEGGDWWGEPGLDEKTISQWKDEEL